MRQRWIERPYGRVYADVCVCAQVLHGNIHSRKAQFDFLIRTVFSSLLSFEFDCLQCWCRRSALVHNDPWYCFCIFVLVSALLCCSIGKARESEKEGENERVTLFLYAWACVFGRGTVTITSNHSSFFFLDFVEKKNWTEIQMRENGVHAYLLSCFRYMHRCVCECNFRFSPSHAPFVSCIPFFRFQSNAFSFMHISTEITDRHRIF